MHQISRYPKLTFVVALALGLGQSSVRAVDKNGVSPNTISRPTGPGSLEGLGDSFQPALNTGTARYVVKLSLPEGVGGFTPQLTLRYDSGHGYGPVGIGWSFGPGCVRRQTDKGLPRYIDSSHGQEKPDRFLGMEEEELVPLQNGRYLAKIDSASIRYRAVDGDGDGRIDHWEAHTKSGVKLEFGLTPASRVIDTTGANVYQWGLERQTDTNGNVVEFAYVLPAADDRQVYLSEVRYGPGAPPWSNFYAVTMVYEDRPDPVTDYRSGFKVVTRKRLARVDVSYAGTLVRRYVLGYSADPHWSLLSTVTLIGDDAVSSLPTTTFGYATFDLGDPDASLSAGGAVIGSIGEPYHVMDSSFVELADLNADGLPDLLDTDVGHFAYLNRGVVTTDSGAAVSWEGPIPVAAVDLRPTTLRLSETNVHLADMTGDGIADLVVTDSSDVEYFGNTGEIGWAGGEMMSIENEPPPAPFGDNSVLTADLDFNKCIDIIQSDSGAYSVWYNLCDGRYDGAIITPGAYHGQQFIDFADPGIHLADMNGDRLADVVKVTTDRVVYCASKGYGLFDSSVEIPLPDRFLDDSPDGNLHRASLRDINGDGLADLVVERAVANDLWFWLNMGDDTFSLSRMLVDLPASPDAETRWADINGNGTIDLIYADSSLPSSKINAVDIGELVAGSAHFNVLTSIDNGYGRRTTISYRSTTDFCVDAREAGNPWTTAVPFPTAVVARTETSIRLDLDGYSDEGVNGDTYITDFVYRDGYYDPLEKQFRGFAFVKQIEHGDERFGGSDAPTLVTRYGFHTGAPDGIDNDSDGATDEADFYAGREEEPLKGVELWRETTVLPDNPLEDGVFSLDSKVFQRIESPVDTSWEIRNLCTSTGGDLVNKLLASVGAVGSGYQTSDPYAREVRQAVRTRVETSIIELGSAPARHLRVDSDIDAFGNETLNWNRGDISIVCTGEPGTTACDDLHKSTEYALDANAEANWMLDRVSRTVQRMGDANGAFVSETRNYYDGQAFQGLSLGQLGTRGLLHRTEALISDGTAPPLTERSYVLGDPRNPSGAVDTLRQQFDPHGNPIVMLDANAGLSGDGTSDGNGHERRIDYDTVLHKFPVTETIVIGGGSPDLVVNATYDSRFGKPLTVTDFNGHATRYTYDTFGRLEKDFRPGDPADGPTHTYAYDLGAPVSSITTIAHAHEGGSPDVETAKFFDGLGRKLGTYEAGGSAMSQVTRFNPRGTAGKVYQPYFGQPLDRDGNWIFPDASHAATTQKYDAAGRVIETITPQDDAGRVAHITRSYQPLQVIEADGEDNNVGGPHHDTPKTLVYDGLDRLIEVQEVETLSAVDSCTLEDPFVTRYRYAMPDLLAEIEDANQNIKYMRYDGLGRKIFVNDCDRGHMTYAYDAVGNLTGTVDAKIQEIVYTYDGANRLLAEDYLDSGTPLSLERTPDIAYHYDQPSSDYPSMFNTKGQLAWIEDLTGAEFRGYDMRGNLDTTVKRIDQIDGGTKDYTTVTQADSLDRVYQIIYPDGGVVRNYYDSRGLLASIPGFLEDMTYHPSGQRDTAVLGNAVTTTYKYDPRLRLKRLFTESPSEVLQDLSYIYDQADNITRIADGRTLPPDDPRNQTADYAMDNLYRLQQAVGEGYESIDEDPGEIDYDYDRLGNMSFKTSPNIPDDDVYIGTMCSGGIWGAACENGDPGAGTCDRIGRELGDPPGPHALTFADNGTRQRWFDYDDNGNMIDNDGDLYTYDFNDRLGKVEVAGQPTPAIRYLYDYTGRRVIKRVDGVQTTYISKTSEIRDEKMINYVFAGETRLARVDGMIEPTSWVTQRIPLLEGWNLISFQVDPGTTNPAVLLADLGDRLVAAFGHDGSTYAKYIPGASDNTLTQMLPNHGCWMLMTDASELLVEGPISVLPVELRTATPALIGLPGLARQSTSEFLRQYPAVTSAWSYSPPYGKWQFFASLSPEFATHLADLVAQRGYWMTVSYSTNIIIETVPDPTAFYYHDGAHGSIDIVTDTLGQQLSESLFFPFGGSRYLSTDNDIDRYYGYAGKERDSESTLHYFEARHYSDAFCRFISVDPLDSSRPDVRNSPVRLNPYGFVANSPFRFTDSSGMAEEPWWVDQLRRHGTMTDPRTVNFDPSPRQDLVKLAYKTAEEAPTDLWPIAAASITAGAILEVIGGHAPVLSDVVTLGDPNASTVSKGWAVVQLAIPGLKGVPSISRAVGVVDDALSLAGVWGDLAGRSAPYVNVNTSDRAMQQSVQKKQGYSVFGSATTARGFQQQPAQTGRREGLGLRIYQNRGVEGRKYYDELD